MNVSPTILQLGPAAARLAMSCAEFDAAEFEPGFRYELIHAVLVVNPAPLPQERGPNERLGNLLWAYQQTHPLGSNLDDTLPEHDIHVGEYLGEDETYTTQLLPDFDLKLAELFAVADRWAS